MKPSLSTRDRALMSALALFALTEPEVVAKPTPDLVVQTSAGAIAGAGGDIVAFKGIPYAAPPVGPLRWQPPQPPVPWSGVRAATHFGADCMQTPYVISTGQKTSEDCLTLSVWIPAHAPNAQRAVMVFIYGGAFIGGYAGKAAGELIDPTAEDAFWREQHPHQPYAQPRVHDAENLIPRVLVTLPPACEPSRDLFWGRLHDTRTNEHPLL